MKRKLHKRRKSIMKKSFSMVSVLILVMLGVSLSGCASTYDLTINPSKYSNQGKPYYVFIKHNDRGNYLSSDYSSIYHDFAKGKIDQKIFINPKLGEQTLKLPVSDMHGTSVYFIFKDMPSDGNWKLFLPRDYQDDLTVDVLNNNNIQAQAQA